MIEEYIGGQEIQLADNGNVIGAIELIPKIIL